jgi:hypothetical protein
VKQTPRSYRRENLKYHFIVTGDGLMEEQMDEGMEKWA